MEHLRFEYQKFFGCKMRPSFSIIAVYLEASGHPDVFLLTSKPHGPDLSIWVGGVRCEAVLISLGFQNALLTASWFSHCNTIFNVCDERCK